MSLAYKAALATLVGLPDDADARSRTDHADQRIRCGLPSSCVDWWAGAGLSKTADEDYIELNPDSIRTVETVPDPVPEPVAAAEPSSLLLVTAIAPPHTETKLTPADLHQLLAQAGSAHNVDEDLLASLVKMESGGNAHSAQQGRSAGA